MKASDNSGFPTNEKPILLSSLYLAPVEYYSKLFRASNAQIEIHDHYTKQSYRNRCIIAGANGPLPLSIPIEKPSDLACEMKDIRIADHGNWRHLHWNAIVSAYKSTPFFDYYADYFSPFYEKKIPFLLDFNELLRNTICRLLELSTPISFTKSYVEPSDENKSDFRETIHPSAIGKHSIAISRLSHIIRFLNKNSGFCPISALSTCCLIWETNLACFYNPFFYPVFLSTVEKVLRKTVSSFL